MNKENYSPFNEKKIREDVLLNKIPLIKPLRFIIQKYENCCWYYGYLPEPFSILKYQKAGFSTKEIHIICKRIMLWYFFFDKNQNFKYAEEMYWKFLKEFNLDVPLNRKRFIDFAH
jgi:hypothetical protein